MSSAGTKRISLAAKFNGLTISLILATSIGICFFLVNLEISNFYQELLNHGVTIADSAARNCEFGIYTEDEATLSQVGLGLGSDETIAYVSIMNRSGRVLASRAFGSGREVPDLPVQELEAVKKVLHLDFESSRDGERYLEILYPVMSTADSMNDSLLGVPSREQRQKIIGYLRLGLTTETLRNRIRQLLISTVLFTSVLVVLGSVLSILLSRRITSPLERLKAATQEIARGNFDSLLQIGTRDEIADLARSFEHMRDRLRAYHVEVESRTSELTAMNEKLRQEITARKAAEEQLQHDAFHDALTGLPNRALFMDRLSHAIAIAKRRKDYLFAVLFLDLDRFKIVNDSLGHLIGDELLIGLGRRLTGSLRPGDTVARLGGDEFAILLEDIRGVENATVIADRIEIELAAPFTVAGHEVFATASIGIAVSAARYDTPDQILRDADTAMYKAKSGGRANYSVFEPGMHARAVERLRLETDLRRAVERDEFVVFYQPILSLITNVLAGFEALVRWQHPERGLLNPGDFIPLSEETGMSVSIDRIVLREACRQLREWQEQFPGNDHLFVSVNLSNKHLSQADLVERVEEVLGDTGLKPSSLKLEITENVIIENAEKTSVTLARLKALGVRLYIDDFGTGYSSLSYLHNLPIDGLKIDRSFVKRMGDNGENQQIVKTILTLASDMHINVIAEGLETASQVAQIRLLHCEYGQGYLFSRPVDGKKAAAMIEPTPAIRKA